MLKSVKRCQLQRAEKQLNVTFCNADYFLLYPAVIFISCQHANTLCIQTLGADGGAVISSYFLPQCEQEGESATETEESALTEGCCGSYTL